MRATITLAAVALAASAIILTAQTPAPAVIQAAAPAAASVVQPAALVAPSSQGALQLLNAIKAANVETLKKQEATLQQLDELQKAADQIKVFTKRG
jgi:hypothetical protein